LQLERLIYVSRPVAEPGDTLLRRILGESRLNNRRHDITGVLAYTADAFFQVLEGPSRALQGVFDRICKDPRHADVRVVDRCQVHRRLFGDWSMALLHALEDRQTLASLIDALQDEAASEQLLLRLREQVTEPSYQ
jgi:hypothetical protein